MCPFVTSKRNPAATVLKLRPGEVLAYDLRTEGGSFKETGEIMWEGAAGELARKAKEYYKKGRALVSSPPLAPMRERQ